jgi:cyclopropane-fatty-acyl-phospholipid synthase
MHSLIYTGTVFHTRRQPVRHAFQYPIYLYALDLDELDRLDRDIPTFGHNRFRPAAIHDGAYLDRGPGPLREKLLARLREHGLTPEVGRIVLLTSARYFGHVFNPVSFYHVFTPDGALAHVVAEVNNTFGERHLYIPDDRMPPPPGYLARYRVPKQFHVSPFNVVEGHYEFLIGDIRETLNLYVNLYWGDTLAMQAWVEGAPLPLTRANHRRLLCRYPLTPWLTMPRILYQAAVLYARKKLKPHPKPVPRSAMTIRVPQPGRFGRYCMDRVLKLFVRLRHGCLHVRLPERRVLTYGHPDAGRDAALEVRNLDFFRRVALGGDVAFGETYMEGLWDSPDLTALIRLIIENRPWLDPAGIRPAWPARAAHRLRHLARANTRAGSRRNIRRHYDLGNAFFETFLDPTLCYSCARFAGPDDTLEAAQHRKMQDLIRLARIGPDNHVLEIGCGWGGFAVEAARTTGCRVTAITVSPAQYDFARARVAREGLADRVSIELIDYRDLEGRYDRIVSIEMLEAVGHRGLGTFFAACEILLAPDGLMALQVITIPDQRYAAYRRGCDWIQTYIFPGGLLPSLGALNAAMTAHSGFIIEALDNIGPHYARTLRTWRRAFEDSAGQRRALGFDDAFERMWRYYFCYCEAAFATRTLEDLRILVTRPHNRTLGLDNPADTDA